MLKKKIYLQCENPREQFKRQCDIINRSSSQGGRARTISSVTPSSSLKHATLKTSLPTSRSRRVIELFETESCNSTLYESVIHTCTTAGGRRRSSAGWYSAPCVIAGSIISDSPVGSNRISRSSSVQSRPHARVWMPRGRKSLYEENCTPRRQATSYLELQKHHTKRSSRRFCWHS